MSGTVTMLDKKHFKLEVPFQYKDIVADVPSSRWFKAGYWKVPVTYPSSYIISKYLPEAEWDEAAMVAATKKYDIVMGQYKRKLALGNFPYDPYQWSKLSNLQQIGANWLAHGDQCVLADEMGSGKTVQSCLALNIIKSLHVLVISPPSVMRVWERHALEWTFLKPFVAQGSIYERRRVIKEYMEYGGGMLIMSWASLRVHARTMGFGTIKLTDKDKKLKELNYIDFDVLIADEAHRAKEPQTKQTRTLWSLNANHKWALTGTPIANGTVDFWSMLRFIAPLDWSSRIRFINKYCTIAWNPFAKAHTDVTGFKDDMRQEFDHLTQHLWLRRSQKDIIGREIKKIRMTRYAYLTPKQRTLYKTLSKKKVIDVEKGRVTASNALTESTRLLQLSMATVDLSDEYKVQLVEPSPKVTVLMNLLTDLGDIPVVIMSSSKQLLNLAAARLTKNKVEFSLVTGDTPQNVRDAYYDDFYDGRVNYLLTTTGVSSEGVDFSRAQHMVMLQRPWSLIQSSQAEDRIRRWTQKADQVTIIDIVTANTVDEKIRIVLNKKKESLAELTYDDVKDLFT